MQAPTLEEVLAEYLGVEGGVGMNLFPWKSCFCGCNEFKVQQPVLKGKRFDLICMKCKCRRVFTMESDDVPFKDGSVVDLPVYGDED